jgi:hypothetical protein
MFLAQLQLGCLYMCVPTRLKGLRCKEVVNNVVLKNSLFFRLFLATSHYHLSFFTQTPFKRLNSFAPSPFNVEINKRKQMFRALFSDVLRPTRSKNGDRKLSLNNIYTNGSGKSLYISTIVCLGGKN